jgi:hypothetical protein
VSSHCFLYVIKPGEDWQKVDALHPSQEKLKELLQLHLDPLVTVIEGEEANAQFKSKHDRAVVGSFSSLDSADYKQFSGHAQRLLNHVRFGAIIDPAASTTSVSMTNAQGVEVRGDVHGASENMTLYYLAHTMPLMQNYSYEGKQELEALSLPIVHVWHSDDEATFWDTTAPKIAEAASLLRGVAQFVLNTKSESYKMAEFGLDRSALDQPLGLALAVAKGDDDKYGYEPLLEEYGYEPAPEIFLEEGFWSGKVVAFVEDVRNNKVKPSYKSEPLPSGQTQAAGTTGKLVWKSLAGGAAAEEDQLVMLCKTWTSKVDKARTAIARISRAVKAVEGIRVLEYNYEENHVDSAIFPGVATTESDLYVFFRVAGKAKAVQYKGKLKQADLLKFLKKRSPAVKHGWDAIKAELALVKDELAAKKKAEEEAAAAKKAEEEEAAAKKAEEEEAAAKKAEEEAAAAKKAEEEASEGEAAITEDDKAEL